jgi:hypothetical protein
MITKRTGEWRSDNITNEVDRKDDTGGTASHFGTKVYLVKISHLQLDFE